VGPVWGWRDLQGAMFEITTHINGTTRHIRLLLILLVGVLVAGALTVSPARATPTGYGWPVKPFTSEHPVRGNFGDPRTVFHVPPTTEGALAGSGSFQFHFGVDITGRALTDEERRRYGL
jgi:hypothetical protein